MRCWSSYFVGHRFEHSYDSIIQFEKCPRDLLKLRILISDFLFLVPSVNELGERPDDVSLTFAEQGSRPSEFQGTETSLSVPIPNAISELI